MTTAKDMSAEIEAFITLPTLYEMDTLERAQVRSDVRATALAHLLGTLQTLIDTGAADAESVANAIHTALAVGTECQRAHLARHAAQ